MVSNYLELVIIYEDHYFIQSEYKNTEFRTSFHVTRIVREFVHKVLTCIDGIPEKTFLFVCLCFIEDPFRKIYIGRNLNYEVVDQSKPVNI